MHRLQPPVGLLDVDHSRTVTIAGKHEGLSVLASIHMRRPHDRVSI